MITSTLFKDKNYGIFILHDWQQFENGPMNLAIKKNEEDDSDLKESIADMLKASKEGSKKEQKVTFRRWEKVEKGVTQDENEFMTKNAIKQQKKKVLEVFFL